MRGASNKDTEKQYKYSSRHAPFKHASLARSSKSVSEQKGREMQEGKKKKKKNRRETSEGSWISLLFHML